MSDTKQCEWCRDGFDRPDAVSNRTWTKTRYCSDSCVSQASAYRVSLPKVPEPQAAQILQEAGVLTGIAAYLKSTSARNHPCVPRMIEGDLYFIGEGLF